MPKKISIKTVDGNRYEYDYDVEHSFKDDWLKIRDGTTIKSFYIPNIVSITETEIEDAENN